MTDKTISAKEWREAAKHLRVMATTIPDCAASIGETVGAEYCEAEAKKAEQREACERSAPWVIGEPAPTVTAEDLRAALRYYDAHWRDSHAATIGAIIRDYAERKGMGPL